MAGAGCRRAPAPPFARAFALEGGSPRVLVASTETAVPLTLTNTGQHAWDPARVHLSYHWVWLVPRELPARSRWDLPYHEGIRTDLDATVPAGGRVALHGRLLAPSVPGVYWLQWDMVEEGVEWFAQESPRQPRTLVVVRPSAAGAFAPLPLLIAIAGLVAIGAVARRAPASGDGRWRRRVLRLLPAVDVIWCTAALLSKQLLLVPAALLEPKTVAYWLTAVTALLPPLVALLVLPRRSRAWTLLALGLFGTLLILADVIYYRFFGDLISTPALLAARQTGHVFGSIRSLLSPELLWLVVDVPFAVWLIVRLRGVRTMGWSPQRPAPLVIAVSLLTAGLMLGVANAVGTADLDRVFRNRAVVEELGPFGYHAYDAWSYLRATTFRRPPTDEEIAAARAWFAGRRARRAGQGPLFGAARGRNLIVVQVESLQDLAVDYRVADEDVMPTLKQWSRDSLRFTRVTDQTNEGRTSDAELTTLASLLPLDHGAAAFRYAGNHYVGLPRVLGEYGYATLSAVAFEPGFWNRQVMHPAYGFGQTLFERDFTLTEQIGWGLNDRDFLQQMVPKIEALSRPFCAWLITLSLHHPFDGFPERHKVMRLGALEHTGFGNYLHTMRFFDTALAEFTARLAHDGLLDSSVVVVFGDHDAGFPRDERVGEAEWTAEDRVPLFIRVPGAGDALRGERDLPAGQTDFAPTLLGLLGIDAAPLPFMGRNLLGDPDNPPVVRPFGEWLDRDHLFITGASDARGMCYDVHRLAFDEAKACAAADERARAAREMSRLVLREDLQTRLR
jgi:lipoteichoic acid synthase